MLIVTFYGLNHKPRQLVDTAGASFSLESIAKLADERDIVVVDRDGARNTLYFEGGYFRDYELKFDAITEFTMSQFYKREILGRH